MLLYFVYDYIIIIIAALKFCFKTCVAMKFVDDDDDDDDDDEGCLHIVRNAVSAIVKPSVHVCLSVCAFVHQTRELRQNKRNFIPTV